MSALLCTLLTVDIVGWQYMANSSYLWATMLPITIFMIIAGSVLVAAAAGELE